MTEQDWLTCVDSEPMLKFLKGNVSDRKLRLFACACCRRIWDLLTDKRSRCAVEIAEQYADSEVSDEKLKAISGEAASVGVGFGVQFSPANAAHFAVLPGQVFADRCAMYAARAMAHPGEGGASIVHPKSACSDASFMATEAAERKAQASLVHCIFGNPFRLLVPTSAWLAPKVVQLAKTIYDERAFDRLPILADALEKAGCDDPEILNHCRGPRPHFRGCWVVDAILGKE